MPVDVVIVGASARAMAASAVRAGFRPALVDLFGDEDARALGPTAVVPRSEWPQGVAAAARAWPGVPRMGAGGLENHPEVVSELAADGPWWGVPAERLATIRTPEFLAEACQAANEVPWPDDEEERAFGRPLKLKALPIWRPPVGVQHEGGWLCKSVRGSAGRGVRAWTGEALAPGEYLQRRSAREPISAAFCGTQLVGVTRQLVGREWLHAPEFAYCGSLGPTAFNDSFADALTRFAQHVALPGCWGLDLLAGPEEWAPLDLNPRWTASMELLDRAGGVPMFARHAAAFGGPPVPPPVVLGAEHIGEPVLGKAILHAPAAGVWRGAPAGVELADIPAPGTAFAAGEPLCTAFVGPGDWPETHQRLRAAAALAYQGFAADQ